MAYQTVDGVVVGDMSAMLGMNPNVAGSGGNELSEPVW
jgi:hypothetical protein